MMALRFPLHYWQLTLAVAIMMTASLLRAQTPAAVDLRSVAGRPDVWPHDVLTKAPASSGAKGAPAIPAGTAVKVVGLEGPLIDLDYKGALIVLPVNQTDFLERAGATLAQKPAPPSSPRVAVAPPATPGAAPTAPGAPGVRLPNAVGVALAPTLLVFDPASKVDHLIPGDNGVADRGYLLLVMGGGKRWGAATKELNEALQIARSHAADFDVIYVPLENASVQSTIAAYRESGCGGPIVDPRKTAVVADLWSQYGHAGTFALALVDAKGQILTQTVPAPNGKSVDKFHSVTAALMKMPPR